MKYWKCIYSFSGFWHKRGKFDIKTQKEKTQSNKIQKKNNAHGQEQRTADASLDCSRRLTIRPGDRLVHRSSYGNKAQMWARPLGAGPRVPPMFPWPSLGCVRSSFGLFSLVLIQIFDPTFATGSYRIKLWRHRIHSINFNLIHLKIHKKLSNKCKSSKYSKSKA